MTWHTATTTRDELTGLISEIRHHGGTVASCQHCASGVLVTWFTY